jgi:hypothetical protein
VAKTVARLFCNCAGDRGMVSSGPMFGRGKQCVDFRSFQRRVGLLLGVVLFACTVLQGSTYCFCGPDLGGCGEHSEHGSSGGPDGGESSLWAFDACGHLTIGQLQPADRSSVGGERVASVPSASAPFVWAERSLPAVGTETAPDFDRRHRCASPYHLTFIARSTQILC